MEKVDKKILEIAELAWMELGDTSKIVTGNPLITKDKFLRNNPHIHLLKIMRQPEYFGFTCKHLLNVNLMPIQIAVIKELWTHSFPLLIGSRGFGKSYLLAIYSMLRALFHQGSKVVIVGTAFRQAKIVFDYCETLWTNGDIFRNICGSHGKNNRKNGPRHDIDRVQMIVGDSTIIGIPVGDGTKIRGLRASYLINDEFQDSNREIFENVIAGFSVVSASPFESVKQAAKISYLKSQGVKINEEALNNAGYRNNQTILSGTANYQFNHFYEYYNRYKAIIESGGDHSKLREVFNGEVPPGFDHKQYSVIRVPYDLLPRNYLQEGVLARGRATMYAGMFEMEFATLFLADSIGFFKRSLIESCTCKQPIKLPSGDVQFGACIYGHPKHKYIIAIDPASEHDNFAVVILEIRSDHNRVVYCWTTTRKKHNAQLKKGYTQESNFYAYCVRKVRDLMKSFDTEYIIMDSQGGGYSVLESFHDSDKLEDGEVPFWEIIEEGKEKPSDDKPGKHNIKLAMFRDNKWLSDANHGLKKDMLDKTLIFPYLDAISIAAATRCDASAELQYDTLEDCVYEIEEMKKEVASIQHTTTPTGMEHWDSPQIVQPGGKKARIRKDRYTALIMANWMARNVNRGTLNNDQYANYTAVGGLAQQVAKELRNRSSDEPSGPLYSGPAWFTEANGGFSGGSVVRRNR